MSFLRSAQNRAAGAAREGERLARKGQMSAGIGDF